MDRRARLTITDIVVVLLALAAMAAIYPAYDGLLADHGHLLNDGQMLIFQTIMPVMLIIVLSVLYLESVSGMAR